MSVVARPHRILVSACLLGQPVRYDGRSGRPQDRALALLHRWQEQGCLVPICPEVAGGLPIPRPAAEILGPGGAAVWRGEASLHTQDADAPDPTEPFKRGAKLALALAQREGCRYALLTERSPSCGSRQIYDGSFSRQLRAGEGVTTALLRAHGIEVFSPEEIEELARRLGEPA